MYFYYGNSAPPFVVMLLQQLEHGLYYSYRKPCASYRPDVITTARACPISALEPTTPVVARYVFNSARFWSPLVL